jgi:hypothetical protein
VMQFAMDKGLPSILDVDVWTRIAAPLYPLLFYGPPLAARDAAISSNTLSGGFYRPRWLRSDSIRNNCSEARVPPVRGLRRRLRAAPRIKSPHRLRAVTRTAPPSIQPPRRPTQMDARSASPA